MIDEKLIECLFYKYYNWVENRDTHLNGLLYDKPANHWDYAGGDTLLYLQNTRNNFIDKEMRIIYHQVTELVLKIMVHELKQLIEEDLTEEIWTDKLFPLNLCTSMPINSFGVIKFGMSYENNNVFRSTLTPASGFQSAQIRVLEISCTRLTVLVNHYEKKRIRTNTTVEKCFNHLYRKGAGYNRKTGKKTLTLRQFEEKYQARIILLTKQSEEKHWKIKLSHLGKENFKILNHEIQ